MSVQEMNAPAESGKNKAKRRAGGRPFVRGDKRAGRPKGVPNKLTTTLKDMILQSLSDAGGSAYLLARSQDQPAAYMALIGRVLPLQVRDGGAEPTVPAPVRHVHEHLEPSR